jgi:drug/metabolite transporter (DMT)-like permease
MTRRGWLLFIAIAVFWGIPYFFIKVAVQAVDPTVVVFARVGIATVVLLPVATRNKSLGRVRGRWRALIMITLVQLLGPYLLITYGEQRISSSLTSILIALEPLLVATLAIRFDPSERVGGLRLVGLALGPAGVVTLLGLDANVNGQALLGAAMVLLATAGYALGALLLRRQPFAALPKLGVVTVECLLATGVLLPLALTRLPAKPPGLEVMVSLLILGVICAAVAWLTFFALIAEVGASRGTVFTYVSPAISVLLGSTVLGEPLSMAVIAGFTLIIVGSWLSTGGLPKTSLLPRTVEARADLGKEI